MAAKCGQCGGPTYTTRWDTPVVAVTYCTGCNKQPFFCTCRKKT